MRNKSFPNYNATLPPAQAGAGIFTLKHIYKKPIDLFREVDEYLKGSITFS